MEERLSFQEQINLKKMQERNETIRQLKEIIGKYDNNPEYVNAFLSRQQAEDALREHYKNRYIKTRLD